MPKPIIEASGYSRYLRTSWMLSAEAELVPSDFSRIRRIGASEVRELVGLVRKRNLFARISYESNFYLQRIARLSEQTVIEVIRPGDPQEIYGEAERAADLLEKIVVLSTTLALKKDALNRILGISSRPKEEVDFVIGAGFRYLLSRSKPEPRVSGVGLDETLCRRFQKCGFPDLYVFTLSSNGLADRVSTSLGWLFESRIEPRLSASVVKTAIALESLLVLRESEALTRSLSERVAFILTSLPDKRERLSRIIKRFYDVRSGVVHGSKKKLRRLTPELVESTDRICLLLLLVLAANTATWTSVEDLRLWCERQRWDRPASNIQIPFAQYYLTNAMKLAERE